MKFYILDCFAEEKYHGNELLVVIPDRPLSDREQQQIAREINFSETSFILSGLKEDGGYDVRIWTPNVGEVPFAGHPTLGTAYVIHHCLQNEKFEKKFRIQGSGVRNSDFHGALVNPDSDYKNDTVKLNLKAGQIPVKITESGLIMSQNPPVFGKTIAGQEIAAVFGIPAETISDTYPVQWVSTGLESVIVPLNDRDTLSQLKMDPAAFARYIEKHPENYCNHLFFVDMGNHIFSVRCLMEDFVEDPATGSANGGLAAYFLKHKYFSSDEISYTVYQGEDMGRRSVLHLHASHLQDQWTIEVGGNCHIVASGNWE